MASWPSSRMRRPTAASTDQAVRDKLAVQDKIRKEFDLLSAVALHSAVAPPPTPQLPRPSPASLKVDRLRPMVWATRLLGLSPVVAAPSLDCGRPRYLPSRAWLVYSLALNVVIVLAQCHRGLTFDLIPANKLVNIMFYVSYIASFVGSLFCLAGLSRKFHLLARVLSWPTATYPTSGAFVAPQVVLPVVAYAATDAFVAFVDREFILQAVRVAIVLWFLISMLDRLMMAMLVKRAGHGFANVNAELRQLAVLVRARPLQYLPNAATKVALLRAEHHKTLDLLDTITKAFELQMIGILLYEFTVNVLVVYLVVRKVSGTFSGVEDFVNVLLLNMVYGLAGTCAVCLAGTWTNEQGSQTAGLVHRVLRCPRVTEEETQELTIFSLQLMHTQYTVDPMGIVAMDNTLIGKLCLSVLMYVVVMIQFGASGPAPAPQLPSPSPSPSTE